MSLCASLEHGIPGIQLRQMIGTWTHREYPLLAPRPNAYPLTVRNLADAAEQDRAALVSTMASAAWMAWSAHHGQIRAWLDVATPAARHTTPMRPEPRKRHIGDSP
jgi:hypothetical protein